MSAPTIPKTLRLAVLLICFPALTVSAEFVVFDNGQADVGASSNALRGTSGLTYLGGNRYAAVDDIDISAGQPRFHELQVDINSANGQITGSSILSSTNIAMGSQYEGIAWDGSTGLLSETLVSLHSPQPPGFLLNHISIDT